MVQKSKSKLEEAAAKGSTFGGFKKMKDSFQDCFLSFLSLLFLLLCLQTLLLHNPLEILMLVRLQAMDLFWY